MNLELPFGDRDPALDTYLTEMDEALEPLFLEAVGEELERLRAARAAAAGVDENAVA